MEVPPNHPNHPLLDGFSSNHPAIGIISIYGHPPCGGFLSHGLDSHHHGFQDFLHAHPGRLDDLGKNPHDETDTSMWVGQNHYVMILRLPKISQPFKFLNRLGKQRHPLSCSGKRDNVVLHSGFQKVRAGAVPVDPVTNACNSKLWGQLMCDMVSFEHQTSKFYNQSVQKQPQVTLISEEFWALTSKSLSTIDFVRKRGTQCIPLRIANYKRCWS